MRITIAVLLALLIIFTYCCSFAQSQELKQEQGPYFWDFGQVSEGDILEHTFTLRNDSPVTLRIKNIHSSCGCTTSNIEKRDIFPGESVKIKAKFNTRGYSGIKKQFVFLHTNHQDRPIIKLVLKADIQTKAIPDNN